MNNKESIINSVNKAWPKDLIIRYLYVKLAPTFRRDLSFYLASSEEQLEIYNADNFTRDGENVVCKTICEYYHDLFLSFNIESKIIKTNNKSIPHYGLIVRGDKNWFFIDPLKDLMHNQVGFKTTHFGIMPLSRTQNNTLLYPEIDLLPFSYVEEMDTYLNLLTCGMYLNDFFDMFHESIFHHPSVRLLEFLDSEEFDIVKLRQAIYPTNVANRHVIASKIALMNNCVINIGNCSGLLERDQFYDSAISYIFSRVERKNIKVGINPNRELCLTHLIGNDEEVYSEYKEDDKYQLKRKKKDCSS